jgi:hypothetical protein
MADEKKRIIQLPALDLADVPVGAFFPVDSATDEQDSNTGAHKVAVSDVVDAIENAIATSEQAEQAVQDLADDVETLSEECARNDIIATPYIEDGSVHGYRVNAIVTHANKLYQNQTVEEHILFPSIQPILNRLYLVSYYLLCKAAGGRCSTENRKENCESNF